MCTNNVLTQIIHGRTLTVVVIVHEGRSGDRRDCPIKLAPEEFHSLDGIFPDASWALNNGYPAILTRTPNGRRTKLLVGRALDYLEQLSHPRKGRPRATSKGRIVKYRNDDRFDVTPENRVAEKAAKLTRPASSSHQAGWIIEARIRLIGQRRNPDEEFRHAGMKKLDRKR